MTNINWKDNPEGFSHAVRAVLDDLVTSCKEANQTYGTPVAFTALAYAVAVQAANVIAEHPDQCPHVLLLEFQQALLQMSLGPLPVLNGGDQPKPRYLA